MPDIPIGYLVSVLIAATITYLALWPRPTNGPRVTPSLVLAMSGSEIPFLFLALNLYGLINWRRSMEASGEVPVLRMTRRDRWLTLAGTVKLALLVGALLHLTTDAAVPFADSANTALALAAQFWQARRRVETWALWCLVNLVSVGLYASQALWFTSAVYAVLLGVALYGWRAWGRAERGMA